MKRIIHIYIYTHIYIYIYIYRTSGGSSSKGSAWNAGDLGLITGSGRFTGERIPGIPLQYSCLENSMDGGTWWATVHGIAKSWTWLSDFHFISYISKYLKYIYIYIYIYIYTHIYKPNHFAVHLKLIQHCKSTIPQ